MPNISETSASDISLSPAWSVMIIFLPWIAVRAFSARRVSVVTWAQSPVRSGQRLGRTARPVADWRPSKDLSHEGKAAVVEQRESKSHDHLGRRPERVFDWATFVTATE